MALEGAYRVTRARMRSIWAAWIFSKVAVASVEPGWLGREPERLVFANGVNARRLCGYPRDREPRCQPCFTMAITGASATERAICA